MKMISSSRSTAVLAIALVAAALTSCQSISTKGAERQLNNATRTEVLGFNGAMAPQDRQYASYGPLHVETRNAIREYIKTGTVKEVDYARPQYYVVVDNAVWAICSDTHGNMTGIMALPGRGDKNGISQKSDARTRPASGSYELIVNETEEGPAIGYAIMSRLEPADTFRKSVRKRQGLTTSTLSAPPKPSPKTVRKPAVPTATSTTPAAPAPAAPAAEETPAAPETGDATAEPTPADTATDTGATPEAETPAAGETPAPAPEVDLSFE